MIDLEKIISSNIEMLNEQEAELLKSLDFIRKAKQLFQSQNGNGHRKVGRPVSISPLKTKLPKHGSGKRGRAKGQGTRISKITDLLKNGPLNSNELVNTLFKQQKEDKDFPHFRQLIYTTLTNAYRKGIVKRKDGKLSLVK